MAGDRPEGVRALIKAEIERRNENLKQVSIAIGKNQAYLHQFMERQTPRRLPEDVREKLEDYFGFARDTLKTGGEVGPLHPVSSSEPAGRQRGHIQEIDVRAGMGAGGEALIDYIPGPTGGTMVTDAVRATWELPQDYLHAVLGVRAGHSKIVEVLGDSMEPTLRSGDRVMVNLADRRPSPPGVFALWDGFGVVVKRLEHIPNSDPPTLTIKSDNPHHDVYQRTAEEVNIIGRVIWFARRL